MKYIVVIGDGMADNAVPALLGKTPLEAAKKPLIDRLAAEGELGTVRNVPTGMAPGSDTAILSIFGYDPRRYFSGRSPLEAAGSGISLREGDVSYRCNMVALEDGPMPYEKKKIRSHSGGSVDGESSIALMEALLANDEFAACAKENQVEFNLTPSFRHIAVQKDASLEGISLTPPHDHLDEEAGPLLPKGNQTAKGLARLMEIAHRLLDGHPINQKRREAGKPPANCIWFWAEGRAIGLPSFVQAHGKKGFVVSAVPLVCGIGALAGLSYVEVEGATGELDTNFEGKVDAILKGLAEDGNDFALLHVEAPDECTHNGDLPGKVQAIEWLDSRTIKPLLDGLDAAGEDYRLLVLSDHKTLTATRGHDGDPVPYILYDSRKTTPGSGRPYTEKEAEGGPFVENGDALMGKLFEED